MKEAVVAAMGVQATLPEDPALQPSPRRKPAPIAPAPKRTPADERAAVEQPMTNWVGQCQFSWVWDRDGRR